MTLVSEIILKLNDRYTSVIKNHFASFHFFFHPAQYKSKYRFSITLVSEILLKVH